MLLDEERKIIFSNFKPRVNVGYTIFTDKTIISSTPAINGYGIRIPAEIGKYFIFPRHQKEQFEINVDYTIKIKNKTLKFLNIKSQVYMKKIEYPNRKNRKKPSDVVFIKPIQELILKKFRGFKNRNKKTNFELQYQLKPTSFFEEIQKIRMVCAVDFTLEGMELVTTGGLQKARFEVYRNKENQIFVKMQTSIRRWGKITLSTHLRHHIVDFFNYNEVICKRENNKPFVVSTYQFLKGKRIVFELRLPHFSKEKKGTTVIFTHPDFKLTEITKRDFEITRMLRKMDFPIKSFYTPFFNGHHPNHKIEKKMRKLIRNAFSKENYRMFSDVQVTVRSPLENRKGNRHAFDDFIINTLDNSLILVEYKTSFTKATKYVEIDSAIAEMHHYRRKLGENVYLIIILNDDLIINNEIITKTFGLKNNLLLIGKKELEKLNNKPELLFNDFEKFQLKLKEKKSNNDFNNTPLMKSLSKKPMTQNAVLMKNKELIINKLPQDYRFIAEFTIANEDGEGFEREIQQFLEKEGYEVVSNYLIGYYKRKMEIDLIGFRKRELILASCRNASSVNCHISLKLDIKQKACKIEYRKFLLNADRAKLYIKVRPKIYQKVKELEGFWAENVEVTFVESNEN